MIAELRKKAVGNRTDLLTGEAVRAHPWHRLGMPSDLLASTP
jgi:hypothetical protein